MKAISLAACLSAAAVVAAPLSAQAGIWVSNDPYEYKVDRFTGGQSAKADLAASDCKMTKTLRGELQSCFVLGQRSSLTAVLFKSQKDWDLLSYGREMAAPVILKLKSGGSEPLRLPVKMSPHVGSGYVTEVLQVDMAGLRPRLGQIASIELQYGSSEFEIHVTPQIVCAANLKEAC